MSSNGSISALAGQVESLQRLIEDDEREHEELSAKLDAVNDRLRRLKRAVAALTSEPAAPPPERKRPRDEVPREKVERVFAAYVECDRPIPPSRIAQELDGVSPESARKAVEALRQEGRLRLVGKTRGGGRAFTVVKQPTPEPAAWTPGEAMSNGRD